MARVSMMPVYVQGPMFGGFRRFPACDLWPYGPGFRPFLPPLETVIAYHRPHITEVVFLKMSRVLPTQRKIRLMVSILHYP